MLLSWSINGYYWEEQFQYHFDLVIISGYCTVIVLDYSTQKDILPHEDEKKNVDKQDNLPNKMLSIFISSENTVT